MASELYKITGQTEIEVADPPPTNTTPTEPNSSQGQSTSPLTPNPSTGDTWSSEQIDWKPPKNTTNSPKPDGQGPTTNLVYVLVKQGDAWIYVPMIPGGTGPQIVY